MTPLVVPSLVAAADVHLAVQISSSAGDALELLRGERRGPYVAEFYPVWIMLNYMLYELYGVACISTSPVP